MKRIIVSIVISIVIVSSSYASVSSTNASMVILPVTESKERGLTNEEVRILNDRLNEIHKLSKTNLTKTQRQELRQEVLSIKERITEPVAGGIYISAGALILIIILLIIIL